MLIEVGRATLKVDLNILGAMGPNLPVQWLSVKTLASKPNDLNLTPKNLSGGR